MTEAEWNACTDPKLMLELLRDKVTDRKLRLYFCGGCRCVAHLFFRPESLNAVEVAEQFADGRATAEELFHAEFAAESPTFGHEFDREGFPSDHPVKRRIVPRLIEMGVLPESARSGRRWQVDELVRARLLAAAYLAEASAFCANTLREFDKFELEAIAKVPWPGRWLIDCVFDNPFRSVSVNPFWLRPPIPQLAGTIYEERTFDRLPILADALEDAGCTNADILNHCRQPGEHVRGCWVVDLLLGKK